MGKDDGSVLKGKHGIEAGGFIPVDFGDFLWHPEMR